MARSEGSREASTALWAPPEVPPCGAGECQPVRVTEFTPEDLLGPLNQLERKYAPEKLFVAGDPGLLRDGRRVSVIGSRNALPDALRRTRKLVRALVRHEVIVTSGLAAGVDTAAHRQAIASGGQTVAVLGTPVNRAYPKENAELHAEIVRAHAAVSQFPLGTQTRRGHFPQRNRTMALLSDATVIVAASEGSGTFYQAWEALRLGRDLLVMESLASRGVPVVADLLNSGARVLSDANLNHWLGHLPERGVEFESTL